MNDLQLEHFLKYSFTWYIITIFRYISPLYKTHICGFIHPTIRPNCGRTKWMTRLGLNSCSWEMLSNSSLDGKLLSFFRSFSVDTTASSPKINARALAQRNMFCFVWLCHNLFMHLSLFFVNFDKVVAR